MIEYQVNVDEQLAEIRKRLAGMEGKAENILRKAIRNAGTNVRKTMLKAARERYAEADKKLLGTKTINVSQQKNAMSVTLSAKGRPNDLSKFEHTPKKRGGKTPVAARVLAQNAMKQIGGTPKPFIAVMSNGHVAIMRRVPGEKYKYGPAFSFF